MVIVLMGVSGSGKTTIGALVAERLGWSFYDGDDFHPAENKAKMRSGIPLTDADRAGWLSSLRDLISQKVESRQSAVVACSALKEIHRERLRVNEQVKFVHLRGTYEQIEARMKARTNHFMRPDMLRSQFEILEEPADAVVVDLSNSPDDIVQFITRELNL
jgi:gluconokinase